MTASRNRPTLKLASTRTPATRARVKQAVRLFRNDMAPRSIRRHNARAWLRSIEMLGVKWRLAVPIRLEALGAK